MLSKTALQKMLGEVTELYEDSADHLRRYRLKRILENAAFYRGLQYLVRSGRVTSDESAQVINITRPIITKAVADTIRQIPEPRCPAARDDQKARARANMNQRLCKSFVRTGVIDEDEIHRTVSWMKQTGSAWVKTTWNPNAGKAVRPAYTGFEALMGEDGETIYEQESGDLIDDGFGNMMQQAVYQGQIEIEFVNTIDGLPNPSAKTRRELNRFFHRKLMTISEAEQLYPVDAFGESTFNRFQVSQKTLEQLAVRGISSEMDDPYWNAGKNDRSTKQTLIEIIEMWETPSKKWGNGRLVIFTGALLLYAGPNIHPQRKLPFTLFNGDNIVPGALYADGLIEDIKQLQRNLNLNESKLFEHLDKVLNFHILAPFGSGVSRNTWGNKSGQVIGFNRGMKPEPWSPQALSSEQFAYAEKQIERAFMITGYNQLLSDLPSNVSGRTVAFTDEMASRMREPDQIGFRRAMMEVFQHALWQAREEYDEGRLIEMVGENNEYEIIEWNSDEFDLENDIVMDVYAEGPQSHAAKISEVLEFNDAKLFEDSPAAERARAMLPDNYAYKMGFDPHAAHRDRAKRENAIIRNMGPEPLTVKTFDVHKVHIKLHDDFMVSAEFEKLPLWIQQKLLTHRMMHEEYARRQGIVAIEDQDGLQAQMMAQPPGQLGPGMPPEMGAPPSGGEMPEASQTPGNQPAPPPSMEQFNEMSDSERRAADQA